MHEQAGVVSGASKSYIMRLQPSKAGCPDRSPDVVENEHADNSPSLKAAFVKPRFIKPRFIKPRLICYGAVVDLTKQLGGSLTPDEREAQGLD